MMSQTNCTDAVREAVQANKDHQHALKVYTERLEAELQTVDKLLETADADLDGEPDINVGGCIHIPGSVKASGLLTPSELLSEDSPFFEEAARRSRYLSLTEVHPMTKKDLETLKEAVRTENYRMHALDAQRRGNPVFASLSDQPSNYLELNKEGLDWDRIAEKVSSASMYTRTARECEIRWLGDQHPCFNHGPWTQDEITKLKGFVAEYGCEQVDWEALVDKLGTHRTPLDCMIHGTTRKIHLWTPESDERMLEAVSTFGHDNWSVVACHVSEDATPSQCQNRYQRTLDPSLKHKAWSDEEDSLLRLAVQAHGTSWVDVATAIPGRHNDQCRDRWNDVLNPAITKGKWTKEEDQDLLAIVQQLGTSSWKDISNRLGSGRTDSMVTLSASEAHVSDFLLQCRNRYNNLQQPKISKSTKTQSQTATFSVIAQPSMDVVAESSRAASRKRKAFTPVDESTDMNEFVPIEESSSALQPRSPSIHVTTRTADSAIMFLDPIISVNPETHKKRTREVLGMSKSKKPEKMMKSKAKDPDASATAKNTHNPSISTNKGGRKKKAHVEPASEEMPVKKAPRPRARPVRGNKNAAPGTMVLDLGAPSVPAGNNNGASDQGGPSAINPGGPGLVVQCCHVSELGLRPPSPNRMG
ncbi:hypothetical protein DEU56DRAFT_520255 [Suillus clintonianus]|uniref:uncharacterized protein n=1 Tax=Suillus clintonianus TaxID=1904413 RepID=UPI001B85F016|nr:uncharacterized protein DEU56DRAFT_520255 [Suillus clintonianus]KAG2152880.1 hypothetical protein DEU56DRAFT_520255 [Suillus clintonianus]